MAMRKKAARKKAAAKSPHRTGATNRTGATRRAGATRKWSARVMQKSDALDLEPGVFKKRSPRDIALSLKQSAEASRRRKVEPFRSAMSMLNFHINRGGAGLTAERRRVLNQAKQELRKAFDRQVTAR
jgi:hypothetical protein